MNRRLVSLEMRQLSKSFLANVANVGLLVQMNSLVSSQIAVRREGLGAVQTDVGSLAGVRPHMRVQITLSHKDSIALGTCER